jgi:adenylate cyclase
LLEKARSAAINERFMLAKVPAIDVQIATEKARVGDLDGAIELSRLIIDELFESGGGLDRGTATSVLVETLLRRGRAVDLDEARSAVDTLEAATSPGFVVHELPLLRMRALLAAAQGEEERYRNYADSYLAAAQAAQFDGHLAQARAMAR